MPTSEQPPFPGWVPSPFRKPDGGIIWQPPNFAGDPFLNAPQSGGGVPTPGVPAYGGGGGQPGTYLNPSPWDFGGGNVPSYAAPTSSTGGGWPSTFWGQTLINTGLNLATGYLQNRAQSSADSANRKAIEDRIRQALAKLSPENINALAQQYLPQMAANLSTAGQTAVQGVRAQAARTGQLENPRALSFEAGTRAKLAGDVQRHAFDRAFDTANQQASAITGAPYVMQQPRMGYADAVLNSVNQAYFARARTQPQTPYKYPGFNLQTPTDTRGLPEYQRMEGTPYQWGFNPARY